MRFSFIPAVAALIALGSSSIATALPPAAPVQTGSDAPAPKRPTLIVAISVDQFSADLFAEYRQQFTGGFARLMQGAVFPDGYQAHAATETCPGHSVIMTGDFPAHTGIIANNWVDLKTARTDKNVYCVEDETAPGSSSDNYTVSPMHLMVPTLGERMKAADARTRLVSVSGKDRAALMMAGHNPDEIWYWGGKSFVTLPGRTAMPAVVDRANKAIADEIAQAQPVLTLPPVCAAKDRAIDVGGGKTVGTGRFARAAGDGKAFRASPEFDGAVLALAAGLVQDMKLGKGDAPDVLTVSVSATDYVGHAYGTQGTEMCLQLLSLDRDLGDFFKVLDATGVDYVVALTADHGGHDLPERIDQQGFSDAARIDPALDTAVVGPAIAKQLGLTGRLLYGAPQGDIWIDPALSAADHKRVLDAAVKAYAANPQVAAAFTRDQILATPMPKESPERWSLIERARASFYAPRSGDLVVALKPRITPIADPTRGNVATHGSFWDYDRRVPILFWRKGMGGFEQPLPILVADIMPTLAGIVGFKVPADQIDGQCRDIDPGPANSCQ